MFLITLAEVFNAAMFFDAPHRGAQCRYVVTVVAQRGASGRSKVFFFFFFSSWWPRSYTRERILLDRVTSEFVFPIRIETLTAFAR